MKRVQKALQLSALKLRLRAGAATFQRRPTLQSGGLGAALRHPCACFSPIRRPVPRLLRETPAVHARS